MLRLFVIATFLLQASPVLADYIYLASTPDTTSKLPLSVGGGKGQIAAGIAQVKTASWSLFEVWGVASTRPGVYYHATVVRQTFTSGRLLWTFVSDSDIWFKYITLWAADDVTVTGPVRLMQVDQLTQAQCEATALRTLVRVTSDAGTLVQPQPLWTCRDAGCAYRPRYWPDGGAVLRCGTGGYYLRQWRYGGSFWAFDPNPGDVNAAPVGVAVTPPPVAVSPTFWDVPPAPTTKQCTVPIGQSCP